MFCCSAFFTVTVELFRYGGMKKQNLYFKKNAQAIYKPVQVPVLLQATNQIMCGPAKDSEVHVFVRLYLKTEFASAFENSYQIC